MDNLDEFLNDRRMDTIANNRLGLKKAIALDLACKRMTEVTVSTKLKVTTPSVRQYTTTLEYFLGLNELFLDDCIPLWQLEIFQQATHLSDPILETVLQDSDRLFLPNNSDAQTWHLFVNGKISWTQVYRSRGLLKKSREEIDTYFLSLAKQSRHDAIKVYAKYHQLDLMELLAS